MEAFWEMTAQIKGTSFFLATLLQSFIFNYIHPLWLSTRLILSSSPNHEIMVQISQQELSSYEVRL